MYISLLLLYLQAWTVLAATAAQWRGRSIYQVLTDRYARTDGSTTASCNTGNRAYCGGTWRGLINKLDYIKNMGFTAVWISPVTQQIQGDSGDGTAYHGYWQNNINALNSAFGTADDLKALSAALHARGMYLMVDVVPNHYAWGGLASSVDYSTYVPFNSASYFHKYCPITQNDYDNNQTAVENCWLGSDRLELTDLDTTNSFVISTFNTWIKKLVTDYGIDGLRIDTVKHVQKSFWPGFNSASGVYCMGEVFHGDPAFTCPYQNYLDGVLNFPLFYSVLEAFRSTSGSMPNLVNKVNAIKSSCKDSTLLGSFVENHDVARFPSLTSDLALDKNAIAFTMLADGIPIIYQGQEARYSGGSDPANREALWLSGYSSSSPLYGFIALTNQIRNWAIFKDANYLNYKAYPIYSDTTTITMRKGFDNFQIIGVFSNKGVNGAGYFQTIPSTGFAAGSTIVEIYGCTTVVAGSDGGIGVSMGQGAAKVFYPADALRGSGICGY